MALDATVGGINSNSYLTEAAATAYLANERLYDSLWVAATTTNRERALIWATFLLDSTFYWNGNKTTVEQALRWPRSGVVDADENTIDQNIIPSLLKKATSTLALSLIASDRAAEPTLLGLGFSQATLGPISVTIDKEQVKDLIPEDVIALLEPLGSPKGGASQGTKIVKLYRA